MVSYFVGVIFGILAGVFNFAGQILMKKAINDLPPEIRSGNLIKTLLRNRTWLSGIIMMIVFCTVFLFLAQQSVGAALIPGLMASGFIVLAIGSVKILKEELKKAEIIAIIMLISAVLFISFSQLSIEATTDYFRDSGFLIRIFLYSAVFTGLWWGLFLTGKRVTKSKSIFLALGNGFPFVLNNIWMGPLTAFITPVFTGTAGGFEWTYAIICSFIIVVVNVLGVGQYQYALNAGNASIVVPMQQLPQQVAPVIIYYMIYQFASPTPYSLPLLLIGIVLITVAGFILASRQASLEKMG
jgi:multidrug transporter EmrE-like cation transporter